MADKKSSDKIETKPNERDSQPVPTVENEDSGAPIIGTNPGEPKPQP